MTSSGKEKVTTIFWDVDTQRDFIEPNGKLYVKNAELIKPNLEKLTQYARMAGIRILGSVDWHVIGDEEIVEKPEDADFEKHYPPHCLKGDPGSEKIMETRSDTAIFVDYIPYNEERINEIINSNAPIYFRKKEFDVFTNPNVLPILNKINPSKIVIYGVAADVCVKYAIDGLAMRGNAEIYLVIDAIEGINELETKRLVHAWQVVGVIPITTEQVLKGNWIK
ncbi:MAG: cysteine hydrolase family protein [Candidatus Heimdallarchaeaceae archaeon]